MSTGLYSGVSGLALGIGLYKGTVGLWSGSSGLITGALPTLSLNFLTGAPLDSRITFSRTTNATLVDSTGRVTYAPNNLVLRSEEFDNAAWTKTASTITPNAAAAPNGAFIADKLVETTAASTGHFVQPSPSPTSPGVTVGQFFIYSVYAKAGERTFIQLIGTGTGPSGGPVIAGFDLTNGTAGTPSATVTSTITPAGDGWYRCSMAFPISTAGIGTYQIRLALNSVATASSYTGDGTSGLFIWGAQFEQVTYQTTPGTYNQTVASAYYGPRFDYNPLTLAPRGLLIEEQRVNLLLRSEEFDNATWTKTRSSITANATTSPDGTANADRFVIDITPATNHAVGQSASVTSGTTYALTVFAKADQFSQINLRFSAQFPAGNAYYDLNSGTVSSSGTVVSASMTSFGNGWWRCVLVMTANATGAAAGQIFLAQSNSITILIGDGTSGVFLYGAQLEAGSFATSYIPTVASTVTRAADLAVMTGSNFSSWYNASEGTYVVSADSFRGTAGAGRISQFDDGTTANNIRSGQSTLQVVDATIVQVNIAGTPLIPFDGTVFQFASAYKLNDFATVTTGAVATDTSGTVPTVNQLVLGSGGSISPTTFINGHIRTFTFYPQRLPNTQLQELAAPPLVASLSLDFINGTYQA